MAERKTIGVGIIGAGFVAQFHVDAWAHVRDGDVVAVASRTSDSARRLAAKAEETGVGSDIATYTDVAELVRDPRVDAVWVLAPNDVRLDIVRTITSEVISGRAQLIGIAAEKPFARTVSEATAMLEMIKDAGLLHAYLENQVYSPAITRAHQLVWQRGAALAGSPYLARCAEEHSGPDTGWFWDGMRQGGGVLNDMMCHSVEAARFMLTPPGTSPSDWLTPRSVTATVASLKWGRRSYARQLSDRYQDAPNYTKRPSEDYARATYTFTNGDGEPGIAETTTSWSYVGAGLRLSFELLGPEYAMESNTLNTESRVFFSRELQQEQGEDMVEKQNAEQGLIPVVSDEAMSYGYTGEDAALTRDFLYGRQPLESLDNGAEVVELLMAAYASAQNGEEVTFPTDLRGFVPDVAAGTWNPRRAA
jgi:predicted dehydrogenase